MSSELASECYLRFARIAVVPMIVVVLPSVRLVTSEIPSECDLSFRMYCKQWSQNQKPATMSTPTQIQTGDDEAPKHGASVVVVVTCDELSSL